jgi:uncharacterized protein (DUF362 family)
MIGRRDVLRIGATGAAALGTVAAGLLLHAREGAADLHSLPTIKDHRLPKLAGAVDMVIAHGADPTLNTRRAIEALGGMGRFVKKGERVAIKPNIGWNRLPEQAANTNPDVVAEVVRQVRAAGASKIWVTDASVNTPEQCFARSGIQKAAGEAGATIVLPEARAFREVDVAGRILRTADVLYPIIEADRVINIPIVKQHGLSGATLSMKNWYGVLGGQRVTLHQSIFVSIVDLAVMVKPTLTILDATRALMANGPTGGNLADVKAMDLVAAGSDEVAIDAFGATLLGLDPFKLGFVIEGLRVGLGTPRYKDLKLVELGS